MRRVRLGDIASVVAGATPKTNVPEYWDGDIRWVTPADLSKLGGAYIGETARRITEDGLRSCAASVLPPGSVLLSSRAPIGHVAINTVPMATNQGFKSLVPLRERANAKYVYYWLKANTAYLNSLGNGATFKELSKEAVERIELPLPPIEEQRRIAAILDAADAIRVKRRALLSQFDVLIRASFLEQFGDPTRPSSQSAIARIGSLAQVVTGNSPSRANPENFGDAIEWIKSGDLGGPIATRAEEGLSPRGRQKARVAPVGSVLVTCIAGSPTSIGKCSLVDREVAFNQQINAVLPSEALVPAFLLAQLKVAPQLVRLKSSGGMKGLVSKSAFESIEIIVPPIVAQQEFADQVTAIDRHRAEVERALAADEELFASLQSRAFSGQL